MLNFINGKSYLFRHALSVGGAIVMAWIANHFFSFSNEYWMVLSALLVCQAAMGTPIRQGYIFLTLIETAILVSAFVIGYMPIPWLIYTFMAVVFIGSAYWAHIHRPLSNKAYYQAILFSCVIMIAVLSPVKTIEFVQNRVMDALIGAFMGIWFVAVLSPAKLDKEFSAGVVPILDMIKIYLQLLTTYMVEPGKEITLLTEQKNRIEAALQTRHGYPGWVYDAGFNHGLRSGFRFFLVHLERITEIVFSMDFMMHRGIDADLLKTLADPLAQAMQKNEELIGILVEYFKSHRLMDTQSDFTSDMDALEKALSRIAPANLELLEVSPHHLLMTALVRDVKDMRGILLQLAMSLPASQSQ